MSVNKIGTKGKRYMAGMAHVDEEIIDHVPAILITKSGKKIEVPMFSCDDVLDIKISADNLGKYTGK